MSRNGSDPACLKKWPPYFSSFDGSCGWISPEIMTTCDFKRIFVIYDTFTKFHTGLVWRSFY